MQQGKVQVETVQFLAEDGYTLTDSFTAVNMQSQYCHRLRNGCPPSFLPALCRICSTSKSFQVLTFDYRGGG